MAMINHNSNLLMITGVARSGTTLLAECIQHHPKMVCFPDPMNELFRAFNHYAHYRVYGEKKDLLHPMDHFFLSKNNAVRKFLENTDLKHAIPAYMRRYLLQSISKRGGRYCPDIKDKVLTCNAVTFDSLFLEIMNMLYATNGKKGCECFGSKEAWCEHVILPLAKTFPNMKFIDIIRDPRAVVSSNYCSSSAYPAIFNIRDWRKSVFYAWKYQHASYELKGRFLSLRYEDLIAEAENKLADVTKFIGVNYEPAMMQKKFKVPNTSYTETSPHSAGITNAYKDKWRQRLPCNIRTKVELCCYYEMKRMGYGDFYPLRNGFKVLRVLFEKEVEFERLGNWCRKILPLQFFYQTVWKWQQYLLELLRALLYRFQAPGKWIITKFFYDTHYYDWIKQKI